MQNRKRQHATVMWVQGVTQSACEKRSTGFENIVTTQILLSLAWENNCTRFRKIIQHKSPVQSGIFEWGFDGSPTLNDLETSPI